MSRLDGARVVLAALRRAAPGRVGLAVRAALCIGVPLAVGLTLGDPAGGAAASFGGLAGLSVSQAPYRYRARVVAAMGAGLVIAVLLGGLAAGNGLLAVLVAGVVAGVASVGCQAAELPPPRELMLVMAVLAATDITTDPAAAGQRAALAAAGALFAWLVTMSPALLGRRREPERRAVAAAFDAVAGLLDAIGSEAAAGSRPAAITAVRRARGAVAQGGLAADHPLARATVAVEAVLEAGLHVDVESAGPLDPGWGRAVRALAPSVAREPADEPLPASSAVGAELLARAIADARRGLRAGDPHAVARPALRAWPGIGAQLNAAMHRHSVVLPSAARMGVAVAVAVGIGHALGLGHAYWVGLTVAAVLQGSNLALTRSRVVQRVVGTGIGVVLAFALLGWGPPLWVAVLAAALFQGMVELVISTHYGLAVVGITVLALLLVHIGSSDEDVAPLIGARLLDTAIGAGLALLLRRLLWPRSTSARLPRMQARVVTAVRRVLATAWGRDETGPDETGPAEQRTDELIHERRRLQGDLSALRAVHADAMADAGPSERSSDLRWPISNALEELSVLALSWPSHRIPPGSREATAFLRHLDELAVAVLGGEPPRPAPVTLPGYPRTLAAAGALAAAVQDANRN